VFSRN